MLRVKATPAQQLENELTFLKLLSHKEYKFHPTRKWRFDFAWPEKLIAVEVEGGIYTYGRHTRASGFEKDLEKYAEAVSLGWRVLRVGDKMILSGKALEYVKKLLTENTLTTPKTWGRHEKSFRQRRI